MRGNLALDLLVLDDPALLEVDEKELARLQTSEPADLLRRDVEQADLRAEHHVPVCRLHPASRAQAVAVERRTDDATVGEGHRGGTVPRLHQTGVEGVEALQVVRQVLAVAIGLRDHHHRGVGQRAPAEHQQLEHVVEGGRVRVAAGHDRQGPLEIVPEELAVQLALAGAHPVDVALDRVDLAVVADHPVGVGQLPAGEGVRGEARVHEGEGALGALVAQVLVEGPQLVADQHALVVDRPRGARGHVQAGVLRVQLADPPDHVELALEGVLVVLLGRTGTHEQLTDDWSACRRHLARLPLVDGHVAPAEQALVQLHDRLLEQSFEASPSLCLGRQEAHQHPVGAGPGQLEAGHSPQQLIGHLHQDSRAVPRARVRTGCAAMLEVLERRERTRDDLMGRLVV